MQYIFDLLNKVKYSNDKGDYIVRYYDRQMNATKEVKFKDIKFFDKLCFIVNKEGYDSLIPLHRIREVIKNKKIIWKR